MNHKVRSVGLLFAGAGLLAGVAAHPAAAQVKYDLRNDVGLTAPCVGIGIGIGIAKKCSTWLERDGFLRVGDIGVDGLTIGMEGKDDGSVTAVEPGSAGAVAGILVGDRLLAVDGKSLRWTAAMEVARQSFGERGKEFKLTVQPAAGGAAKELSIVRGDAAILAAVPKSDSVFVTLTPFVDWRGRFASCSSAGPLGAATVAFCASHFKPFGYVKAKELGSIGFTVDPQAGLIAKVTSVEPGSSAAKAGLATNDTIVAIDGKPLAGSVGSLARQRLFGKDGETRPVLLERNGAELTKSLVLRKKDG